MALTHKATPENCSRFGKLCRHDHLLNEETLFLKSDGHWECYACKKEARGLTKLQRSELREKRKKAALERAEKSAGMREARRAAKGDGPNRMASAQAGFEALGELEVAKDVPERGTPLPTGVLAQRVDDLLRDVDSAITSAKIALATPRDLIWMMGVLIDKRQILKGEPTQRVSHEVVMKLDELGPLIFAEIERRKVKVIDHE